MKKRKRGQRVGREEEREEGGEKRYKLPSFASELPKHGL